MDKLTPRVGVSSLASPLEVGADRAANALSGVADLLRSKQVEAIATQVPTTNADLARAAGRFFAEQHVDAICLPAVCWFEDYLVLDMLEECAVPVVLWALPGMETGALCGTQQLTCYLKEAGKRYEGVFGPAGEGEALDAACSYVRAAALMGRLRRARIGLAGYRVAGMTEVAPNEIALKKTLGPRVVMVDMARLLDEARRADARKVEDVWNRVKSAVGKVAVADEEGTKAASIYLAISETVRREGLSALAFGCYPDLMGRACLAASLLGDEGVPVGCEGDVNGAVGMLILSLLTGRPTHNTDWLDPLPDGSVVFTHCGSGAYSLAEDRREISLEPVRLAKRGVCSLFPARPGPVTLVSLMARGAGYQLALMEGQALKAQMVFPGNPLRVSFHRPVREIIDWIYGEGIGHHWIAGYGHLARELKNLARIAGPGLRYVTM